MAPSIRILFLTESYYPNRGGMAQSCDRIVNGLRRAGLEIDLLHFSSRGPFWQAKSQQGGQYVACPLELNEAHTLNRAWNWLSHPERQRNYDLIMAFGGHLPLLAGPIFSQWLQTPLAVFLRGNDFDAALFSPKRQPILEKALTEARIVYSVSSEKVWKIERSFPEAQARFIANGIDLDEWQTLPSDQHRAQSLREEFPAGRLVLGMIGHLKAKKGFDFLLEAIDLAHAAEQIHLLVVGELPDVSRASLTESGLTWTELPFLDRYELLGVYTACDAVALPSFYDGMPNVLLEALGLGIPVLGADVDGIHDVLRGAHCGWRFHPGDLPGCAQAIRELLKAGPEGRKQAGTEGQQHIARHFTVQQESAAYLDSIHKILLSNPII